MFRSRFFAAILVLLMISAASASSATEGSNSSTGCLDQNLDRESTKDISQGGEQDNSFYSEDQDKDKNIVRRITGPMSDSRKMGIGALLVIIFSVLYAGFNWNDQSNFEDTL